MRTTALVLLLSVVAVGVGFLSGGDRALAEGTTASRVATGDFHACAVTTDGGVRCWGAGRLGNGGRGLSTVPVDVCGVYDDVAEQCLEPLENAADVDAGLQHTCAVLADGTAKCWGWNFWGQLGIEEVVVCPDLKFVGFSEEATGSAATDMGPCSETPVDVDGLTDAVAITVGPAHSCVLTDAGGVKCWGANYLGQLGDGEGGTSQDFSRTPVDVCAEYDREAEQCLEVLSETVAISAIGHQTCGLSSAGNVSCWGWKTGAWLDAPTDELCGGLSGVVPCSTTPLAIPGLQGGVVQIAPGVGFTCVLTSAGGVKCGGGNALGALGDGGACGVICFTPVDVPGLTSDVSAIASGESHTCALTQGGAVKCWGTNLAGEAGARSAEACGTGGRVPCARAPVAVPGLWDGVTGLSGGQFFTCATVQYGSVRCWGNNQAGQLGNGRHDEPGLVPPPAHPIPSSVIALGRKLPGDTDCWRGVTSIDAALLLQYEADLVDLLACQFNADVNDDGLINSVDAALVLQRVAGLAGV
ncbi:MAG: hypothetical protein IIC89_03130 [Chloroflexi bacterium]|nr:hypothetical protein [Chloroflexota bacterium]